MVDKYLEKMRKAIKDSNTDAEIDTVLNRTYQDSFEDGTHEGRD
jgi:hypothetical protein